MSKAFRPFLLNSNRCTPAEAQRFETAMPAVNYNTGNSYISYAVLKSLIGSDDDEKRFAGINNLWEDDLDRQAATINNRHSHVLLFLQDQIRSDIDFSRWDELNQFVQRIR